MAEKTPEKLVALVARGLKDRSAEDAANLLDLLPAQVPADAPARRRVLLAMRIALLRQSQGARPVVVPPPAPPEPVAIPEPEPEVIVAPPPAPKRPPKTLITAIRLEDAAQLLAAAAEPEPVPFKAAPKPEFPTETEAAVPPDPASTFVAGADFWSSDFDAPWPDAAPVPEPAADTPLPDPQQLPALAQDALAEEEAAPAVEVKKPRKRKKAGTAPAPMDAADAAAAMNALFMMGDDDTDGSG
nr:hypothetical protein [Paracoccus saliphilus]